MRIAVTSAGTDLTSNLDPRFGRAAYFMILDPMSMEYEVVENQQNLDLPQGAGIQASKTIINNQVDVLITGNCGPKAFTVLERSGIKVITGAQGRISEVVEQFKCGQLKPSDKPNVEGHWV